MASISETAGVITFTGTTGDVAIAQSIVTTTDEDNPVSYSFEVARRGLTIRVGTTSGGEDIIADTAFLPGYHVITFTPGATTYYIQIELKGVGTATVTGFARLAPGVLELDAPWAASVVPSLRYTQSLNTMWFAGGGEEMHVLERRGQTSWSLRPFLQIDGPFSALNLSDITLTPTARTGTTTLTASEPLFATYDAGALVRLTHSGQFETEDFDGVDQVTEAIEVTGIESSRQFRVTITGTFTGTILLERSIGNEVNYSTFASYSSATSATIDDGLDNQVIYYRFRMSAYTSGTATVQIQYSLGVTDGIARIIEVTADNAVTVDVIEPFGLTSATTLWNFGAWSGRFGQPQAVTLFDGRLWVSRGNAYWGSASDNFGSFDVGPLANQAIARTFGGRMSSARWLAGAGRLLAGLSGFEAEISSNAYDDVLLPENVKSRGKTTKGSADANPELVDDAALFISRSLERIYRFGYSGDTGALATDDLTRLNQDIGGSGGFVEISWQREPEPRLWCVRADGQLAVLVFNLTEGVVAWCRMVHDGFVESVCVTPGTPEDQVHLVVKRTVDGGTVRYIEKLAPEAWDTVEEAWRLHSAIAYSGAATSSLSGLDHLEARTDVYVWGDGQQLGPFTVASGAIADIGVDVTYAIAGLLYEGTYKSARLNWGAQSGSGIATYKQIEKAGLIIHQTAGGALAWGDDLDDMENLADRVDDGTLTFDAAVQVWSGDIEESVMGTTDRDARLYIKMPTAGPATVLGIATTMKTNG